MGRPRTFSKLVRALRRVLGHFGPHLHRQRALVATSMAALVADVMLRLLEPWPLKLIVDHLLGAHPGSHPEANPLAGLPPATLLAGAVAAVVIVGGLRAITAYFTAVGFALVGNRVLTDVRQQLYQHLQRLSLSFHARSGSGELVVRVIGDVGLLKDVAVTALLPMCASLLVLVGMAGVMLWLDWRMGLLALALLPLFAVSTLHLGRQIHAVARVQRRREGSMAARVAESMSGVNTVKALGLEGAFSAMFARDSARGFSEGVKGKRLEARLERSADVITVLATAMVLGYGTHLALRQSITPGDLLVFLSYLKTAFRPVRDFAKYAGRLAKAAAAGERVVDLIERVPDVADRPDAVAAPPLRGAVRFEGVSFAYEPGHPVLHDVSLEVAPGQRVAIVGPSGSGKSTLVGLLMRLHDPTQGRLLLDGRDVRDYTLASVRAQFAVVLQEALLFRSPVRENIAYGLADATDEQIVAAARLAGADDFIRTLPQGYETPVGERGVTLSAGQRQRITIARAALRQAQLFILDEPTSGLDVENQRLVTDALAKLTFGRTTFLITHDPALAATADLVVRLEGGRVVVEGSAGTPADHHARFAPPRTPFPPAAAAPVARPNGVGSLEAALDPATVQGYFRALPELQSRMPGLVVRSARVVRQKPGRRVLIEYELAGTGSQRMVVLGKIRARGADVTTYRLCRDLVACGFGPNSEDGVMVPEPLGIVPELSMWLQARVTGASANTLMAGPIGAEVATRLADALRKLNHAPVTVARAHGVADEIAILRDRLMRLACEQLHLAPRVRQLFDGCSRLAARLDPPPPALIHRDFYPAQAIVDGDRVHLVDLDLCARGDPALDVGNCLGHLIEQGLREHGDSAALEGPAHALAERFALRDGLRALAAADIYATLTLARLVWISTQIPERRSTTQAMLDLCEQRLELGALQAVGSGTAGERAP